MNKLLLVIRSVFDVKTRPAVELKRTRVQSANLVSVGYDEKTKTLEVEFKHHRIYRYKGVPQGTYRGLMSADSPGKYFYNNVRSVFSYKRVA